MRRGSILYWKYYKHSSYILRQWYMGIYGYIPCTLSVYVNICHEVKHLCSDICCLSSSINGLFTEALLWSFDGFCRWVWKTMAWIMYLTSTNLLIRALHSFESESGTAGFDCQESDCPLDEEVFLLYFSHQKTFHWTYMRNDHTSLIKPTKCDIW